MGTFDKAKDALKSELITDAVLDKAAAAAQEQAWSGQGEPG